MAANYEKEKSRMNIQSWMSINPEWKQEATAENVEEFKRVSIRTDRGWMSNTNHKAIFTNPMVAIELGLLEVLQHLVESKLVNVNEHKWNGYNTKSRQPHLLMTAMEEDEMDCFKYIMGIDGIDVGSTMVRQGHDLALICCACDFDFDKRYLEIMIGHKSFSVNQYHQVLHKLLTPLHFVIVVVLNNRENINDELALDKMEMLLNAGADPYLVPSTPTNQHAPPPMYCANTILPPDSIVTTIRGKVTKLLRKYGTEEGRREYDRLMDFQQRNY
jgi:hypothetical protein